MPTREVDMPAAEPTREELKAQLDATRRDMQVLAAMVRDGASARAARARDDLTERLDELSEEARGLLGAAQVEGLRLADEASDTVRRNPLAALGIAFGLGWLIGKLSRR
jgi:ElaB/YqjD/DUF883 family membrane-anchored ribosome-binding protein